VLVVAIFVVGYLFIVLEHLLKVNKSAAALLTGVLCWVAHTSGHDPAAAGRDLAVHLGGISQVLFFVLTAMTIVEIIDAYEGFEAVTSLVKTRNRRRVLGVLGAMTFFLSAVLDNLTTAILMMTLVRRLTDDRDDRLRCAGIVILAANAGGVFSPIGDVTTTMLWVGRQISADTIVVWLVLPALVSAAVPTFLIALGARGDLGPVSAPAMEDAAVSGGLAGPRIAGAIERRVVFVTGMGGLLFVPVFTALTRLPPVMGILLGLGVLGLVTEVIHRRRRDEPRTTLSMASALQRIDAESVLFFLGILLAISALESEGALRALAAWLDRTIGNVEVITVAIGLSSAVIDNVPLVAAAQGMYTLDRFPTDSPFWLFLAYCAGTGGSILIIGSAAGVAVMGIERISFGRYLRTASLPALAGYAAGAITHLVLAALRR
jgi:Na+/H+ antiporter NhaD/arsenite permease-like protein